MSFPRLGVDRDAPPRSLQLNGGIVQPVESEVGLCAAEAPESGSADQPGDRSDEVPDEGPQPVLAGGLGQQIELHGAQQHLRQLPAGVEDLAG